MCAAATVLACGLPTAAAFANAPPGPLTGSLMMIEADNFTIQTNGRPTGLISALTQAATAVTAQDFPYVWGGGHAEAGVASVGDIGGPGANGHRLGYDCSGAVGAVLAAAGLWPAGGWVPNDAGVIARLLAGGVIAPGPGAPPDEVTFYDDPGVHIFMNINGRFFGTSDGGRGANSNGGAGWLDDAATDVGKRAFHEYHIVPSVLRDQTTYGQDYTFELPANPSARLSMLEGFLIGDHVTVGYGAAAGSMTATALGWVGQVALTGTVDSISPDGSQLLIATSPRQTATFATTDIEGLLGSLQPGDTVTLIYTRNGPVLLARRMSITWVPVPETATGKITAIARDLSAFTIVTRSRRRLVLETGGIAAMLTGLAVGDKVQVQYTEPADGVITATQVSPAETNATQPAV